MARRGCAAWAAAALAAARGAAGHAWITKPASSRLDLNAKHHMSGMPDDDLRWCPSCCNMANSCGAAGSDYTDSAANWGKYYQKAGVPLASFTPGKEVAFEFTVTADHGGQSWLQISCADSISEKGPWTLMMRAPGDRGHHFMKSNPGIYAWATNEAAKTMNDVITASWVVPAGFSCPSGRGVGRWVWKTGNSCNDINNVGRKTETFKIDEFAAVVHAFSPGTWIQETCGTAPETFISCFDFATAAAPPPAPVPPGAERYHCDKAAARCAVAAAGHGTVGACLAACNSTVPPGAARYHCDAPSRQCVAATAGHSTAAACLAAC